MLDNDDDDGDGDGDEDGDDEDDVEHIHVDERFFYLEHIVRFMAVIHSLISLFMLIAYYHLKGKVTEREKKKVYNLYWCYLITPSNHWFKVPLAIFKREKEIARRLEFDGLYIAEQPEDDDIKVWGQLSMPACDLSNVCCFLFQAYWDKLVISAKSFPVNYWDKFVKKKVRQKYSETYDFDAISNLLGMEKSSLAQEEEAPSGLINQFLSIDWRYQVLI